MDSSVILDFHLTNSAEVLVELFEGRMLLSDFVQLTLPPTIRIAGTQIVPIGPQDWTLFEQLKKANKALGAGEIGATVIAKNRGAVLLTNDKVASKAAEDVAVVVCGSMAVLDFAVERGTMLPAAAIELLSAMVNAGGHFSEELVEE